MTHPIELSQAKLLGKGNERICFVHPDDENRCIKINRPESYCNDTPEQSLVEEDYYRHLAQRGIPLNHLPECYGWVDTTLGQGLEFERIRRSDSAESLSLRSALEENLISKDQGIIHADELYQYLVKHKIMLSDINIDNISVRLEPNIRFYLVDGIASRNMDWKYKLRKKLPALSLMKTTRQWNKYSHKLYEMTTKRRS